MVGNYRRNSKDTSKTDGTGNETRRRRMSLPGVIICLLILIYAAGTGQYPELEELLSFGSTSAEQNADTAASGQAVSGLDYEEESVEILYTFRTAEQFESHYEKHGIEMGFDSAEEYLEGANWVIASEDALHKLEAEDGDDVYYLESTNEFVVVSEDDFIRTYFEPEDGIAYYNRQ